MTPFIITAEERLQRPPKINIVLAGPIGVGKTTQLRTLPPSRTLFLDLEAGSLAVQDFKGSSINVRQWAVDLGMHPWQAARVLAAWLGGPDPSAPSGDPYSHQKCESYNNKLGDPREVVKQDILFWDSITVAARWCLDWAQKQPEAMSERTGKPDLRSAYGLLGREMIRWLTHIQHSPRSTIVTAIMDRVVDDLKRVTYELQIDGAKTGLALPGIFDEVISLVTMAPQNGEPYRAFVCQQINPFGYPAKDRSGCLEVVEEPDLWKLMEKISAGKRLDQKLVSKIPAAPVAASTQPAAVPAAA